MFVKYRFSLRDSTKRSLQEIEYEFGFGEYGKYIYYSKYSRQRQDCPQEAWPDTVIRVIEGIFSIRKDYYLRNYIYWDEASAQEFAKTMAVAMIKMHWVPPGRGIYHMGMPFVYQRGAMALYNCAFTLFESDLANDVHWAMDALMHGVGVGIGPKRTGLKVSRPQGEADYIIADSREGWCDSVRRQIIAYTRGAPKPRFIYDRIRLAGEPIHGFGGTASGPAPLQELHEGIDKFFGMYDAIERGERYDEMLLKADIANQTGVCVVAGNVRRSAEILVASIDDETFLNLKNYELYPHRSAHGWMSNNAAGLWAGADFDRLSEIAERVKLNAEPGVANFRNFPFGRIGKNDGIKPDKAIGLNPCVTGDTWIQTVNGFQQVNSLIGKKTQLLVLGRGWWTTDLGFFKTGTKQTIMLAANGRILDVTSDHKIYTPAGAVSADQLKIGDLVLLGQGGVAEIDFVGDSRITNVYDVQVPGSNSFDANGLLVSNCGEIPLEDKEVCNLAETCPTKCTDEEWLEACVYASFYCSTVSLLPTHRPETNQVIARNRRIGVSIVGISDWREAIGVTRMTRLLRHGYTRVRETNTRINAEAGVPEAIRVTAVKPGGTVPKIIGAPGGVSSPTFKYTLRRSLESIHTPICKYLVKAGVPFEKSLTLKDTLVFKHLMLQDKSPEAGKVSLWEQAATVELLQREWADNAVSNTLYFKPSWPTIAVFETIAEALEQYPNDKINIIHGQAHVQRYDSTHEEDHIEKVLAFLVPTTKSLALMPHSSVGVYPQMPESGLTKEEFDTLMVELPEVDWSNLIGSDGQDEKYCTKESCT